MNKKREALRWLAGILLGGMVTGGFLMKNQVMSVVGLVLAIAVAKVAVDKKVVLSDEMTSEVAGKAGRATYIIVVPALSITAALFLILGQDTNYISSLGVIFAYISCSIMVIYLLAYRYFLRKYK